VRVRLARSRVVTLSSPAADAEAPAASVDRLGHAAVAFTEWRRHELVLRVATRARSGWSIATLDRSTQPMWSERTSVLPDGTTLAGWIDEAGSARTLRVAVLPSGGRWQTPVTLDSGQGLGSVALGATRAGVGIAAWQDASAGETRVRASLYAKGSWQPPVTLARSLDWLDTVYIAGTDGAVHWRSWNGERATFFGATLHRLAWGRPQRQDGS
jgi:hypothetical protein